MAKVTKKGFGFWKKTIVEHNGKIDVFKGNAQVKQKGNSVCITEKGLLSENTACYLEKPSNGNTGGALPNGQIVGKSKNIAVENIKGKRKEYKSHILSINSMEKRGDQIQIVQNGLFGKKVIATLNANDVSKIESEDCNVCKSVNPVYKD